SRKVVALFQTYRYALRRRYHIFGRRRLLGRASAEAGFGDRGDQRPDAEPGEQRRETRHDRLPTPVGTRRGSADRQRHGDQQANARGGFLPRTLDDFAHGVSSTQV